MEGGKDTRESFKGISLMPFIFASLLLFFASFKNNLNRTKVMLTAVTIRKESSPFKAP